jgi:hypothetical protein
MRRRVALLALLTSVICVPSIRTEPDQRWLADARRELAEREYRASENGQGLQAPNRAHDLRTY